MCATRPTFRVNGRVVKLWVCGSKIDTWLLPLLVPLPSSPPPPASSTRPSGSAVAVWPPRVRSRSPTVWATEPGRHRAKLFELEMSSTSVVAPGRVMNWLKIGAPWSAASAGRLKVWEATPPTSGRKVHRLIRSMPTETTRGSVGSTRARGVGPELPETSR